MSHVIKPRNAASVTISNLEHTFENGFKALHNTELVIPAGTFCTLLGPSGSGKTTLLRIIAGLITPAQGEVYLGDRDVTHVPIQDRQIGFVFQNYALFPHLSVRANIEFPLKTRKLPKARRQEKVARLLELVGLEKLADRMPGELSGGQQQRVAIARALVYDPEVLLLDEPLGALDRKLRQQLGNELRRIQQETGTTAIYVTHDQEEAFILSDTVVVMDHGMIVQRGTPQEVYSQPETEFVAQFLGDTNILDVQMHSLAPIAQQVSATSDVRRFSLRPEDIQLFPASVTDIDGNLVQIQGQVEKAAFMGSNTKVTVRSQSDLFHAELNKLSHNVADGDTVTLAWNPEAMVPLE